jgi:hypothetical protein
MTTASHSRHSECGTDKDRERQCHPDARGMASPRFDGIQEQLYDADNLIPRSATLPTYPASKRLVFQIDVYRIGSGATGDQWFLEARNTPFLECLGKPQCVRGGKVEAVVDSGVVATE